MKTLTLRVVLLSCIVLLFGCREEVLQPENSSVVKFVNPYSSIGELHNEGLSYSLNYLKLHRQKIHSKDDLINISQSGMKQFFEEKKLEINDNILHRVQVIINSNRVSNRFSLQKSSSVSSSDSLLVSLGYDEQQIVFLNRLFNLAYDSTTILAIKDSINSINTAASLYLDGQKLLPVLVTSAVLESSFEYWSSNSDAWLDLIRNVSGSGFHKISQTEWNWNAVGGADAAGAAASLIPCIGATIGYWECVGGAAVGASLWEASVQLWDMMFP